jgi:hypothetical protein
LTVANFDQMELSNHLYSQPRRTGLDERLHYNPPTIVVPSGAVVSVTYDLLDANNSSAILSGVNITGEHDEGVTAAMQGLSVIWRATFTSSGLIDLVVDSDPLAIAAGGYAQKTFNPGANGRLSGTIPVETTSILFGAWVERPSSTVRLLDIDNKTRVEISGAGLVTLRVARGNGAAIVTYTSTAAIPATGKVFIGAFVDVSVGGGQLRIGSTLEEMNSTSNVNMISNGPFMVFDRIAGDRKYIEDFSGVVLQLDGSNTLAELYGNGTPPDVSALSAALVLGGSMTAANFNSDPPVQLGTLALTSVLADRTFTEIV